MIFYSQQRRGRFLYVVCPRKGQGSKIHAIRAALWRAQSVRGLLTAGRCACPVSYTHLHRQDAAVFDTLDKLVRLLNNRHIGGEISIKHLFKADTAQRGDHLAGDVRTNRHSERLAERGADGWSCLDDNVLGRVVQRRPNLVRLILFIDRARRADNDALPTAYAGDLVKVLLKRTGDVRIKAALVRADDADALPFGCLLYTSPRHTYASQNLIDTILLL